MLPRQVDRWRWHVKVALASAIAGACRLEHPSKRTGEHYRPLILGYHRVVEDFASASQTDMPSMLISRAMFERHVEWIGKSFRFVSLDDIGDHLAAARPFTEPVAAITFDDGYADVYENAFPFLRRQGIPAAMFVVTDLIGQPNWQTHDRLYYLVERAFNAWRDPRRQMYELMSGLHIPAAPMCLDRGTLHSPMTAVTELLPALKQADVARLIAALESQSGREAPSDMPSSVSWSMIQDMRRGGMTIGSHTRSHASLPMEAPDAVREEIEGSKRILEAQLGEPIVHFAYPGGHFTRGTVDAIDRAGYRCAYTACPHSDSTHPALTLERLLLWEGSSIDAAGEFSSAVFNCQIHDLWPPARRCERTH